MNVGDMSNVSLSAPLQQLKEEHVSLRKAMDAFYATAQRIVPGSTDDTDLRKQFNTLHDQIASFTKQLKLHSKKEDDGLFPMMAKYIGRESGPIAVMEYEHQQAEQYLNRFLEGTEEAKPQNNKDQIKSITQFAIEAYFILTEHFIKEENVLFPMAENMLSTEEKEQLQQQFQ
ncbi:hemerythrin-like domain-containing protein [Caldalkalibacillus uzonensis]|uniref:Hemerythrin-like domain-containing protein n=2 Tax=Caldalkalibacillus uzonensis TaxID=353224 RepID=A0ABU0CRR9_9BACI|nr:hemerythrin-like domain-containing protein [Caldalkalibacillus uzonensis]